MKYKKVTVEDAITHMRNAKSIIDDYFNDFADSIECGSFENATDVRLQLDEAKSYLRDALAEVEQDDLNFSDEELEKYWNETHPAKADK